MAKNKYNVRFTATFFKQLKSIIKYISFDLSNKSAAEKLYKKIVDEIVIRSEKPESFEKYRSSKNRKNTYYRIYVKNFTIFYVVNGDTMEVRRILYSKRDFKKII